MEVCAFLNFLLCVMYGLIGTGTFGKQAAAVVDDGQHGIEIDFVANASKCSEDKHWTLEDIVPNEPISECYKDENLYHVPMNQPIHYPENQIPNRGPHRKVAAAYGEYDYVPPGRFVHNLEHGGVVFLYHPCTPVHLVDALRYVAGTCTWKHVLSAYPEILDKEYPLAVVVYGCVYRMSRINGTAIKLWLQERQASPEQENRQGSYNYSLIHLSEVPENAMELASVPLCWNVSDDIVESFLKDDHTVHNETITLTSLPPEKLDSRNFVSKSYNKDNYTAYNETSTPMSLIPMRLNLRSEKILKIIGIILAAVVLIAVVLYMLVRKLMPQTELKKSGGSSFTVVAEKFAGTCKRICSGGSSDRRYYRVVVADEDLYSEDEL